MGRIATETEAPLTMSKNWAVETTYKRAGRHFSRRVSSLLGLDGKDFWRVSLVSTIVGVLDGSAEGDDD